MTARTAPGDRSDRRVKIARRVGTNENPRTELRKKTLNSLVAYLTGSFDVSPGKLFVEGAPDKRHLKVRVSQECDLGDYLDHTVDQDQHGLSDRPFNNAELDTIIDKMDETGDRRDWAG